MKARRTILLVLAATSLLAAGVSTATARRFTFTAQPFKIVWEHFEFARISESVRCEVTLEGTYHSTVFDKTIGAQFGSITRATVERCEGSTLAVLRETLPWGLEYLSFTGSLPIIERIRLRVVGLSMVWGSFERCLIATTTTSPLVINFERRLARGEVREARIESGNRVRMTGASCFGEREATPLGPEGSMSRPETGGIFTVSLI